MNSIERENFFDYLSAMYAENANCHFCALREKCQAKDNMGKCYERVLSELMEATKAYPSAEKWVDEMNELQIREKKTDWAHYEVRDKKGAVLTTVVFDMKNAVKRATATCRGKDFDARIGIAIAYARLMGLPIHRDFATKHDIVL